MPHPKVLQPFPFASATDRRAAQKALWCDIPTSILIKGPAASGKTLLARIIAESNGMDPLLVHFTDCDKSPANSFRNASCVILDNQRHALQGGWAFTTEFDPSPWSFCDRKLGTKKTRHFQWSGLLIVTTGDLDAPVISFDLAIELLPKTPLSKRLFKAASSR